MKKKKWIMIIGGVVVVAGLGSYSMLMDTKKGTKVTAAEVKEQKLVEQVSASGRIQPKSKVEITSEINGEIVSLSVKEGQKVKAGDLLIVLDTVLLSADVQQAGFSLDEVTARLSGSKTTLDQNEEEYEIQKQLYAKNHTAERAFKNARYAFLTSESSYKAMQASARRLEAAYNKQLDYLSKAKIIAPMDGIVTFLDAEVGEIAAAQTAFSQGRTLMTISNLNVFEVEVEVDETEINKISLGQDVEIEVDAFPDTTFVGNIVEIGNTAVLRGTGTQDQSTNFKVLVLFLDPDPTLRPGMSADVDITTSLRDNATTVPFSAVVIRSYDLDSLEAVRNAPEAGSTVVSDVQAAENKEEDEPVVSDDDEEREPLKGVFIIREGKARFVEVKTGIADQKNIEITSGLKPGDSVIAGPYRVLRSVKDGEELQVEEKKKNGKGDKN